MSIRLTNRECFCCLVQALLLSCAATIAGAVDCFWENPVDGNFSDPSMWVDGNVPGPGDSAYFDLAGDYRVTLTADVTHSNLYVRRGSVVFDMNGFTYEVLGTETSGLIEIAPQYYYDADVLFTNGTLVSYGLSGARDQVGNLVLTGPDTSWTSHGPYDAVRFGSWQGRGTILIENGAQADMQGFYPADSSLGTGVVHVTGSDSVLDVHAQFWTRRGNHKVLVADQAVLNVHGTIYAPIGGTGGCRATIIVSNAVFNHTDGLGSFGARSGTDLTGSLIISDNGVYSNTSTTRMDFGLDGDSTGFLIVESGGRLFKSNERIQLGRDGVTTMIVRGPDSEVSIEGTGGGNTRGLNIDSRFGGTTTLQVLGGALLRIEYGIYGRLSDELSILDIEVRGEEDEGQWLPGILETGNFYLGLYDACTDPRSVSTLTVADQGAVEVDEAFWISSRSTVSISGGTVRTETLRMLTEENGDRAGLAVALHKDGTGALIDASGEATIDGADFELALAEGFESEQDERFTVIAAGTLTGRFNGVEENDVIGVGDYYQFRASYEGDSFTLTTMPPPGMIITIF